MGVVGDHDDGLAVLAVERLEEEKIGDLYWDGSADLARDRVEAVFHYGVAANSGIASAGRKLAICSITA